MESDKILVMDAGRAVEFAPPLALLKLQDGNFTNLLKQTGQESFDKLKRIAQDYAIAKGVDIENLDVFSDPDNIVLDLETNKNLVSKQDENENNENQYYEGYNNDFEGNSFHKTDSYKSQIFIVNEKNSSANKLNDQKSDDLNQDKF